MNELVVADRAAEWRRLNALVLDSGSTPITRRVYNLCLDEFLAWYGQETRPGFTESTIAAWRVALEARGLGLISINAYHSGPKVGCGSGRQRTVGARHRKRAHAHQGRGV